MLGAASDLIDAADIPLAAEHGVVRAVLVDPRAKALSLPEIKSERIDGANLRGADWPRCGQRPEQHATPVHPCSAIGAYERHCNIRPRFPSVSGSVSCPKLRFCLIIACSSRRTDFRRSLTRRLRW